MTSAMRNRQRRALSALALAVVAGTGVTGCAGQSGGGQRGTSTPSPLTLWEAQSTTCPAHPAGHATKGAVLRDGGHGCIRLLRLSATIHPPLHAEVTGGSGGWSVTVDLDQRQQDAFAKATKAAIGQQLAMIRRGSVLGAPTVESPINTAGLQIAATSKAQAERMSRLLTTG